MKASFLKEHLEKVTVFKVVVEHSSISKAALSLGLSQSTVSHTISKLEEVLDLMLFERKRRGVSLTPSGELLYEFSKRLEAEIDNLESRINNPTDKDAGHLKVVTHETLAIHVWPEFLSQLQKKYPNISVSLVSSRVNSAIHGILNKDYDLALTVEPLVSDELIKEELYSGVFGVYVALKESCNKYKVLKKNKLNLEVISNIPIVTDVSAHIKQGQSIPHYLLSQGFKPSGTYELTSFEAALRLASRGLAIAIVPKRNAEEALKIKLVREVKIQELKESEFGRYNIQASRLKNGYSEETAKIVVQELKNFFHQK